ncbi:hypothetical protein Tco_1165348 [Tanacetum coccineum]
MKRGFRGAPRPLLPAMLLVATTNPNAGQEYPDVAQTQPSSSTILYRAVKSSTIGAKKSTPSLDKGQRSWKLLMKSVKETPNEGQRNKFLQDETACVKQSDWILYRRRRVNTAEGVNTSSIKVSTVSEQVSTDSINKSIPSPDKGQREGKAPMIIEEAPKKTKEQILQEEASLAEAIRLDTLEKEEEAKQVHLDSLLAQRIAEKEELNEQQKKRRAQVQFEAQHYTDEDWILLEQRLKLMQSCQRVC